MQTAFMNPPTGNQTTTAQSESSRFGTQVMFADHRQRGVVVRLLSHSADRSLAGVARGHWTRPVTPVRSPISHCSSTPPPSPATTHMGTHSHGEACDLGTHGATIWVTGRVHTAGERQHPRSDDPGLLLFGLDSQVTYPSAGNPDSTRCLQLPRCCGGRKKRALETKI